MYSAHKRLRTSIIPLSPFVCVCIVLCTYVCMHAWTCVYVSRTRGSLLNMQPSLIITPHTTCNQPRTPLVCLIPQIQSYQSSKQIVHGCKCIQQMDVHTSEVILRLECLVLVLEQDANAHTTWISGTSIIPQFKQGLFKWYRHIDHSQHVPVIPHPECRMFEQRVNKKLNSSDLWYMAESKQPPYAAMRTFPLWQTPWEHRFPCGE